MQLLCCSHVKIKQLIVTINVVKEGTTRVYVLGEVKRQGLYELPKSHNLLDALGVASGFTEYSNKKNVFVVRNGERDALLKVNVAKLLKSKHEADNVTLNDGDCVFLTSNNNRDICPRFLREGDSRSCQDKRRILSV